MHKKLIAFVLCLTLLLSFSACAAVNQPVTDMESLEKEVAGAWAKKNKIDEEKLLSFYYYGTDNGYDILFYAGGLRMEIPDSHTVGSCTFSFATGFELYAHKDGQLTDLDAALEQGLISQQAVQEALNKHKSITK